MSELFSLKNWGKGRLAEWFGSRRGHPRSGTRDPRGRELSRFPEKEAGGRVAAALRLGNKVYSALEAQGRLPFLFKKPLAAAVKPSSRYVFIKS